MVLLAMANKKRQEGKLQESLEVYGKALKISDETVDIYAKSQILDNMSNTSADLGDQG